MGPPRIVGTEMPFRRTEFAVDGVRLSTVDDGPKGAPETLLLLHGNPSWSFVWRKLIARALAAGHRVVVPDHAGFGFSDKPRDPGYYTLDRHIGNLDALVRALDLQGVTLVLHDWGGPIGMGWAVRDPARVHRIVVANSVAFAPREYRPLSRWHAKFSRPGWYRLAVAFNLIEFTAMRGGVRRPLPRAVLRAYAWPMRPRGGRVAAARFVQLVPDGPAHPTAATLREMEAGFPKLEGKPMLVLWADRDPVFPPKFAERWQKSFPQAVVRHVSPRAGHFWQEDDPDAFIGPILDLVAQGP